MKEITMDRVPIVKKISDVFLEDLPTVPPTRAVDFRIKIELGATDISKVTYCMAQVELNKLYSHKTCWIKASSALAYPSGVRRCCL